MRMTKKHQRVDGVLKDVPCFITICDFAWTLTDGDVSQQQALDLASDWAVIQKFTYIGRNTDAEIFIVVAAHGGDAAITDQACTLVIPPTAINHITLANPRVDTKPLASRQCLFQRRQIAMDV